MRLRSLIGLGSLTLGFAVGCQHDVAFALDQAAPMLAAMRAIADPDLPSKVAQFQATPAGAPSLEDRSTPSMRGSR